MTKDSIHELILFIEVVEKLTAASVMTIGLTTTSEILSQCAITKAELNKELGPVSN